MANCWPIDIAQIPDRLPGYAWLPAKHAESSKMFVAPPVLVVIHSGSNSPGVAEYMATVPDGRMVSAHFSWSAKRSSLVQQVSLRREAWHAGGSAWTGQRANALSIGIELPGPWKSNPRSEREQLQIRTLLANLKLAIPALRWLTGHQFIANKTDPGPGVTPAWFEGLGYDIVWSRSAAKRLAKHHSE